MFLLVPGLEPTDPERLHPIPPGFSEEVVAARRSKDRPMLAVLADEAGDVEWGLGGLRLVARAQFALKAWPDALATYEAIREIRPDDPDANLSLGTVYLELGKEAESAAALQRVSGQHDIASAQEAEALALLGRNAKNLWVRDWNDLASEAAKQEAALRSPHLETARTYYDEAFSIDQNHWYSGGQRAGADRGPGVPDRRAPGRLGRTIRRRRQGEGSRPTTSSEDGTNSQARSAAR